MVQREKITPVTVYFPIIMTKCVKNPIIILLLLYISVEYCQQSR